MRPGHSRDPDALFWCSPFRLRSLLRRGFLSQAGYSFDIRFLVLSIRMSVRFGLAYSGISRRRPSTADGCRPDEKFCVPACPSRLVSPHDDFGGGCAVLPGLTGWISGSGWAMKAKSVTAVAGGDRHERLFRPPLPWPCCRPAAFVAGLTERVLTTNRLIHSWSARRRLHDAGT